MHLEESRKHQGEQGGGQEHRTPAQPQPRCGPLRVRGNVLLARGIAVVARWYRLCAKGNGLLGDGASVSRSLLPYNGSLLPYNRSLLTLAHTWEMAPMLKSVPKSAASPPCDDPCVSRHTPSEVAPG